MACGILVSQPGIEPAPSTLGAKVPTTGWPGKSLFDNLKMCVPYFLSSRLSMHPLPCLHLIGVIRMLGL